MGLLSKLWNLNTKGCSLQEPLRSMIESKKYKTMDVVGYLKSVLEDARPYARMKLMLVGIQGIGKTSLLEQLRQVSLQLTISTVSIHCTGLMSVCHQNAERVRNRRGFLFGRLKIDERSFSQDYEEWEFF